MLVQRTSIITGKRRTIEIDVTSEQIKCYREGMLPQFAFPSLTPDQREFIINGTTKQEWEAIMT